MPPTSPAADALYQQYGARMSAEGRSWRWLAKAAGVGRSQAESVYRRVQREGAPGVQPESVSALRGQDQRENVTTAAGAVGLDPGPSPFRATRNTNGTATGPFAVPLDMFPADGIDILVLPDPHAEPGQDLWRFDAFGRMIADLRPHVVVCIGDFSSFDSLSRHASPHEREGQRYIDEVEASKRALERLHEPIAQATGYRPRLVLTSGNHDAFGPRFAEEHPALVGMLGDDPIGFRDHGWAVHRFREPVEIAGVQFCHYFEGSNGKAIGGKHAAASILARLHQSAVWGHSHRVSYHTEPRADGTRMHALNVGVGSDAHFDYAGVIGNREMWRGCWLLRNVVAGDFDPQAIRMDVIRRRWG